MAKNICITDPQLTDHALFEQIQHYSQHLLYDTRKADQNEMLFHQLLQLQDELKRRYFKQIIKP